VLTIEKGADGRALILTGEIDMSNVQDLVDAATELAEDRALRLREDRALRLRMEGVSFIDSTGIRGLLRIAEMTGGELVLVSPHPAVRKVLRVLGLDATPPLRIVEER
jgi:anti-sigma B factor antagonist